MVEQLLQVHNGQLQKDAVFNETKAEYVEVFGQINNQDTIITAANGVISTNWPAFSQFKT